jgi:NAD(P)-dependent dehydrogenase (short-subunit alcohol dehydrogenase family)
MQAREGSSGSRRFAGRAVIVTGAGSGIGRATALLFAAEGAAVVVADLAETGADTVREIEAAAGRAIFARGDVTRGEDAARIVEAAVAGYGRLDVLANVVGGSKPGDTVVELPEAQWLGLLHLNLTSVFQMCKQAVPRIAASGGGAIVNVASGAGVFGMPRNPGYVAAKGGVVALTRALAIDHAPQNIRVNCVSPGAVLTPLMERNRTPEEIQMIGRANALGRLARAEELAQAIAYLASEEASFITGQVLNVDGGSGMIRGI